MNKPLSHIKPSPINEEIYSPTDLSDLELSLQQNGQLEPIVINSKGDIISGHRRYFSMKRLKWKECNVRVVDYDNELISIIEHNRHRMKTATDINNEFRILEKEYKKSLGGQGTRTDLKKNKSKFSTMVDISKSIGVGTSKLKQIKSIYNYEPDLLVKIDKGELSVNKAYDIVRDKHMKPNVNGESDEDVKKKILRFLDKEKPSVKILKSALKDRFPYSLLDVEVSDKSDDELKDKRNELIDNMNFLKKLDEKEIVIYKKLKEIEKADFDKKELDRVSKNIFQFADVYDKEKTLDELSRIKPVLHLVKKDLREFNILRVLIHSMEWSQNPGRNLKYIVRDLESGKYLGVITLGADVMTLTSRDDYIGWTKEDRVVQKRLNNTCIASTIVPTQPLGYNVLLGKLIACMCSSQTIRNDWKKKYKNTLVGVTTTSLYGSYSMYNSIPLWKKVGRSSGKIVIKPDDDIYFYWNEWVKKKYPDEFHHAINSTGPKQNVINLIFRKLGIVPSQYENEHEKGVYFMNLYKNTKEFLKGEVGEKELILNEKVDGGIKYILDWWIPKAEKRYLKLLKDKSLETDTLWYQDLNSVKVESWLRSRGINFSIKQK